MSVGVNWSNSDLEMAGIATPFVQDNLSRLKRNALRGQHYQIEHPQEKLMNRTY